MGLSRLLVFVKKIFENWKIYIIFRNLEFQFTFGASTCLSPFICTTIKVFLLKMSHTKYGDLWLLSSWVEELWKLKKKNAIILENLEFQSILMGPLHITAHSYVQTWKSFSYRCCLQNMELPWLIRTLNNNRIPHKTLLVILSLKVTHHALEQRIINP